MVLFSWQNRTLQEPVVGHPSDAKFSESNRFFVQLQHPMDALDATVDATVELMLQQELDGAPDPTASKLAEHMELHAAGGSACIRAEDDDPARERGAAAASGALVSVIPSNVITFGVHICLLLTA